MKIGVLDVNAQIDEVADAVKQKLTAEFLTYGVSLAKLIVEPFTLPEEVEAMMDKRTSVGMMAPVMGAYTQMQVADSIHIAAGNEDSIAGLLVWVGLVHAVGRTTSRCARPPPPKHSPGPKRRWPSWSRRSLQPARICFQDRH